MKPAEEGQEELDFQKESAEYQADQAGRQNAEPEAEPITIKQLEPVQEQNIQPEPEKKPESDKNGS